MPPSRTPLSTAELLEAFAATLEAGMTPTNVLALLARVGPQSAYLARRLSAEMRTGTLTSALVTLKLLERDEETVVALGEETGRLPLALRWVVERRQIQGERRRAIRRAVIGPLIFALVGLLVDPLPQLVAGALTWQAALRPILFFSALAALGLAGLPRLLALSMRSGRTRAMLPFIGSWARLEDEAAAAALIATFADSKDLALAPRAARVVEGQPCAQALAAAAADPLAAVVAFSEPFALALQLGLHAGDLPARLAAFHQAAEAKLTSLLRGIARVLAFAVLSFVALHAVVRLLSTPLPGLGGDLGNSPEMRELERELDNAGH